jgi:NADH-quinone oxidoreductase subunit M
MTSWLDHALILLPSRRARRLVLPAAALRGGSLALLLALVEVGLWIETVARFDFSNPNLQLDQQTSWFSDLHVSYHVGPLRLLGLAGRADRGRARCGDRLCVLAGREQARAYYGLMLLLTGAIVGVFVAQDLLLFYVFWEAMLIPLYVLVGVWGGAGRLRATLVFVIYTMAGSLLMLASIIVLGLSQGTFDLVGSGTNSSDWIFLGSSPPSRCKAPLFPLHGMAARGPTASRRRRCRAVPLGVVSKAAAYGFLRIAISKFPGDRRQTSARPILRARPPAGSVYGSLLAFRAPDLARGDRLLEPRRRWGSITLGLFAVNDLGLNGAVLQMVNHGLISATPFLLAGGIERRTRRPGELCCSAGWREAGRARRRCS